MHSLPDITYLEPSTIDEAVGLLNQFGAASRAFAGGLDLIPRLRLGKIKSHYLISIRRIPGLECIADEGEKGLRIGAMAVLHDVEASPVIRDKYPVLHAAVSSIASLQVKMMGTVVGNLCVATPASDIASSLIVLGAKIRIAGPDGERTIPVEDLFRTVGETTLLRGEIVTEILVPREADLVAGFDKLIRTASDIAKVNVAISIILRDGFCRNARIALGSVGPTPIRARRAEVLLESKAVTRALIEKVSERAAEESTPIDDIRSTADYRRHAVKILLRRRMEELMGLNRQ